jgi:CRISPR-associated exonuclease Cas4
MPQLPFLPLAIFLAVISLLFFWLAGRQRRKTNLPGGQVIYIDTQGWMKIEKPLYDPGLGLTGKPDYIVEKNQQLIPVEVKTSRGVTAPYDGHIYQLAAYGVLVEKHYGKRPRYGILRYPDRTFAVDFTADLEAKVREVIGDMHAKVSTKSINRSHQSPQRCTHCGFRSMCDQSLRI